MIYNKISVIVPFYNPGEFLDTCINSIMSQKYENFRVYFIDDCSTDGSYDKLPHDNLKATCIKNDVRKTALENIHDTIINYCDKNDIVVLIDGDDWLSNKNVFSYINEQYNKHNCWILYGSSSWTDGRKCCSSEYSQKEFENLRTAPFRVSHLRTFLSGLYYKIQEQDSNFSCLKDKNGHFYKMTYDVAIMLPILELCEKEKVIHNKSILYIYNRNNPISDDKINQKLQWDIHEEILNKKSFKKIIKL